MVTPRCGPNSARESSFWPESKNDQIDPTQCVPERRSGLPESESGRGQPTDKQAPTGRGGVVAWMLVRVDPVPNRYRQERDEERRVFLLGS